MRGAAGSPQAPTAHHVHGQRPEVPPRENEIALSVLHGGGLYVGAHILKTMQGEIDGRASFSGVFPDWT